MDRNYVKLEKLVHNKLQRNVLSTFTGHHFKILTGVQVYCSRSRLSMVLHEVGGGVPRYKKVGGRGHLVSQLTKHLSNNILIHIF